MAPPEADLIPKERYLSPEFMRLEAERLWPRVWLLAGREADVGRPGDYLVFDIGRESILVARGRDGRLHANHNVCQHRGNRLCEPGRGHVPTFTCRYHAWEWNLDGSLRCATDADTFPQGIPADMRLAPVRCDTWGGFVWISMQPDAAPLAEYLDVVAEQLTAYRLDEQVLVDDVTLELGCNWKTCVDAFNETYHVQGTHPELLEWTDDVNVPIDLYGAHSRFIFRVAVPSPRVGPVRGIPAPIRDIVLRGVGVDPDAFNGSLADVRPAIFAATRRFGEEHGLDFSALRDDQLIDDFHYTIFPNLTLNVHGRGFWLFRHRPHPSDPDRMFFDFQDYMRWPAAWGPRERPTPRTDVEGGTSLGKVLDQDLYNLPRVQAGMHSRGFRGLLLSRQERRIRHFHHVLERYVLGGGGSIAAPRPRA